MLSPDPYVQVPEYSQNFNRYSYVLNNPLNKTDPTGYSWLSKAFHKIGSWVKENWRTIASIVFFAVAMWAVGAAFYAAFHATLYAGIQGGIAGALTGAFNAAISGGDILKGVIAGGITGAVGGALGGYGSLIKNLGGATASGLSNVTMGGKFSDGFMSSLKYGAIFEGATIAGKFTSSYLGKKNINEIGGVSTDEHLDTIDQGYRADKDLSYNTKNGLGGIDNSDYNTGSFKMELFYRDRPSSNLDYAVFVDEGRRIRLMTMVGTQTGGDWMDNLLQGLGFKSKQYLTAIEQAQIQQNIAMKQGYTFVINGHSLGGGLAAAASAVTGAPAAIFNAAGFNPLTLRHAGHANKINQIGSNVVHHSVAGEILSAAEYSPLNLALPVPAAANYYVYSPKLGFWDMINPLTPVNLHRPPHTLKAIKE
ncbi:MAG: hypothetical protein EAZ81_13185 [Verrucomicrobia bacterium]|nr:MAG: hypothetical protein EAZ81_13185 [Verrucomicrobiota bacterium]